MAIVTRRYKFVGPSNADLSRFVGSSAARNGTIAAHSIVDIDIDDTTPGALTALDEYMAIRGFVFDASAILQERYVPPEKWTRKTVAASLAASPLSALVSTSFDEIQMIRSGSIVGLSTRFTEAITDATVDSAVVKATINGTPTTLSLSHSSGANPSGGQITQAPGIDTFVSGDLIGIEITTLGSFAPETTDIEAWLDMEA